MYSSGSNYAYSSSFNNGFLPQISSNSNNNLYPTNGNYPYNNNNPSYPINSQAKSSSTSYPPSNRPNETYYDSKNSFYNNYSNISTTANYSSNTPIANNTNYPPPTTNNFLNTNNYRSPINNAASSSYPAESKQTNSLYLSNDTKYPSKATFEPNEEEDYDVDGNAASTNFYLKYYIYSF
jgi:hypothetical protein